MKDNFEGDLPVDYIFVVCSAEGSIHITPALMDIDRDGKQEVFLACDDGDDDGYGMAYAFDSDWNLLWSKEVNGNVRANPCVSDLDGDGNYEFIVATTRGYLYVFNCEDGSTFPGWPQYVGCSSSSPATADFNKDGKKNIVIGTKNGVKIYSYDGHLKYTGYSEFEFVSGPVIVDIDKDGYLDIIAVANNVASPFHYPVWIRYFGGKGFEDMKLELPSQGFSGKIYNHTTPAIADIDGNGWNDIVYCPTVAAGDNGVLCVEIRGTSLYLKWDDSFNGLNDLHSSPAIADVDNDGKGEVIVAGNYNPGINYSYMVLRCYEHNGMIKWSKSFVEWPVCPYSSPSLGQLGKAWLDVAIGSDYGKLYMFSANDGYEITDPKMFALEKIASSPLIADIDGDGKLEIVATSTDHFVYRWERGGSYYSLIEWGKFHHDNFNTGVYLSIPVGLKAAGISESEIKLTWIDKVLAEEGFEILRLSGGVWVVIDSVSAGVTEYIDRNLSPGTEYQYRVRAYCGEYFSGFSNVATGKTYWINPPFSLKVINYTSDYIKIGWQHTSSIEEAYFQIARKVDNDPWEEDYDRVDKNTFQYQDTEIEVAHRYTYKVKAVDDQGHSSPWSNEASIRIGGVAVSNYSGMTAFNNARRVGIPVTDEIYLPYRKKSDFFTEVRCLRSTDGGYTFKDDAIADAGGNRFEGGAQGGGRYYYSSNPALLIDNQGRPHLVFTQLFRESQDRGTRNLIHCYYDADARRWKSLYKNGWVYYEKITGWDEDEELLQPPSFAITTGLMPHSPVVDTGFVVFRKHAKTETLIEVRFALDGSDTSSQIIVPPNHIRLFRPVMVYDPAGRVVIVGHNTQNCSLWIGYRRLGSDDWHFTRYGKLGCVQGGPSAVVISSNLIRISYEVAEDGGDYLATALLRWNGDGYAVSHRTVIGPCDTDPYGEVGYSSLADQDLVLFKYQDDIWYAQKGLNGWSEPIQISTTPNLSAFPIGTRLSKYRLYVAWTEKTGTDEYQIIQTQVNLPYEPVYHIAPSHNPYATGHNNARRLLRDGQKLHLVYTDSFGVYHTYLADTSWSIPQYLGRGEYPCLFQLPDGKIGCIYPDNFGHNYHELLRITTYDGSWSSPDSILHTYDSNLWGIGAPSVAIRDSIVHFTFESSHGMHHYPPEIPIPQRIHIRGKSLIYGRFPVDHPEECTWQVIDSVPYEVQVDTNHYLDSLIPILVSPSITVDPEGTIHILWDGNGRSIRYYRITDTITARIDSYPDSVISYPYLTMRNDQIDHFWINSDSIKYRFGWTGMENLSAEWTIGFCEHPFSSGSYLTWTRDNSLYLGAIPAGGLIDPYLVASSDRKIYYPQIVANSRFIDLVWTEYDSVDLADLYYHQIPITEPAPLYNFNMGTEVPLPILVRRDGHIIYYEADPLRTIDYGTRRLSYRISGLDPSKDYRFIFYYYYESGRDNPGLVVGEQVLEREIDPLIEFGDYLRPKLRDIERGGKDCDFILQLLTVDWVPLDLSFIP
ncbi:hypothetical protein DRP53_09890, partial [candidate division WOR-3 bacterium]